MGLPEALGVALREAQGAAGALREARGAAGALRKAQGAAGALREAQGAAGALREALREGVHSAVYQGACCVNMQWQSGWAERQGHGCQPIWVGSHRWWVGGVQGHESLHGEGEHRPLKGQDSCNVWRPTCATVHREQHVAGVP